VAAVPACSDASVRRIARSGTSYTQLKAAATCSALSHFSCSTVFCHVSTVHERRMLTSGARYTRTGTAMCRAALLVPRTNSCHAEAGMLSLQTPSTPCQAAAAGLFCMQLTLDASAAPGKEGPSRATRHVKRPPKLQSSRGARHSGAAGLLCMQPTLDASAPPEEEGPSRATRHVKRPPKLQSSREARHSGAAGAACNRNIARGQVLPAAVPGCQMEPCPGAIPGS
jgi:hypothetical protein